MVCNLRPLIQILEDIASDQKRYDLDYNKLQQLTSLLEKVIFLDKILEKFAHARTDAGERLESQIEKTTFEAVDIIESHIADQIRTSPAGGDNFLISLPDLQQIINELDFAIDNVSKMTDQMSADSSFLTNKNIVANYSIPDIPFFANSNPVGFERDFDQLKDRLTTRSTNLDVVAIVGMGGIGKTTLVKSLFNDPFIMMHFDIFGWVTISQQYNVREILLKLLRCITCNVTDEMLEKENHKLGHTLYKYLTGNRYFVVLDDIWDINVLDEIRTFLPDSRNGSRIVLTSRVLSVGYCTCSFTHEMRLLNDSDSWKLLCGKVFGKENCPLALEKVGKIIAGNCNGLPLTIIVIGGFLAKGPKEKKYWEHVAKDVTSIATTELSGILMLSYDHLPVYLRSCLLHIAAFPEGYEIRTSKLIKLWVAEGFLDPHGHETLEEMAELYLQSLFDKCLIFIRTREYSYGRVKSYSMHSLFRHLCIRIDDHKKFIHIKNNEVIEGPSHIIRRMIVHPNCQGVEDSVHLMSTARSFISTDYSARLFVQPVLNSSRLLRILDVLDIVFLQFPEEIFQLVNIHYLALTCYSDLPCAISRLWKLQTLIFRVDSDSQSDVPSTIWNLTHLRHFKFKDSYCWVGCGNEHLVLINLQTLSYVDACNFTRSDFVERIPNIRKLGVHWGMLKEVVDLSSLRKLETLKICHSPISLTGLTIPSSVKNLTLSECGVTEDFIRNVGSLPKLEVFKMRKCNFVDQDMELNHAKWEIHEGEFESLKFLLLEELNIVHLQADESCFPGLQHLVIRHCSKLEKITVYWRTMMMSIVEMDEWSPSAVASARRIFEEQGCFENDEFKVHVRGLWLDVLENSPHYFY